MVSQSRYHCTQKMEIYIIAMEYHPLNIWKVAGQLILRLMSNKGGKMPHLVCMNVDMCSQPVAAGTEGSARVPGIQLLHLCGQHLHTANNITSNSV